MILYINNEHCMSLEKLRDLFTDAIDHNNDDLMYELVENGREDFISDWLEENNEKELALSFRSIDENMGDIDYFSRMSEILLRRRFDKPDKPAFEECFKIESIKKEKIGDYEMIYLKLKILRYVNEPYDIYAETELGRSSATINPFKHMDQGSLNINFRFVCRDGMRISHYQIFADDKRIAGYEAKDDFVDLGLSVLWSSCNKGAASPYETGDYFLFDDACKGNDMSVTFDVTRDYKGQICYNSRTTGKNKERLPTMVEFKELLNNCMYKHTTKNGVDGCEFVSNINGKSLFFPSAGIKDSSSVKYKGKIGCYWSRTRNENAQSESAYALFFNVNVLYVDIKNFISRLSVRTVKSK